MENQLLKYEDLPFKGKDRKDIWYKYRKSRYHRVGDSYPWQTVERILENNIGKSYDIAFSYYCKLVPKYQQRFFLDEVNKEKRWRIYYNSFYVDDDGNIQKNNNKPKKIIKVKIKESLYEYKYFYNGKNIVTNKKPCFNVHYESIIIEDGYVYFESKNDPRYQKLIQESIRKDKKKKRKSNIKKLTDTEYRNILKQKEIKEKEENLIKIISHGFDPLKSFRKIKKEE